MQTAQPSVFARDHTILGVCEALGEDLGFNPVFLRVPLAVCLLLNPWAVVATYAALGLLVAFTRLVAPNPRPAAPTETEACAIAPEQAEAEAEAEPDMALAA
jgi:phage shock protein PspC (stress-responsive transcriptional regulator)